MVNAMKPNEGNTSILTKPKHSVEDHSSSIEGRVFKAIIDNDLTQVKNLFATHNVTPHIYDQDGMTPLQHACYKGNKDMVEFLIEKGARPNDTLHEHRYMALHFAALSGNSEICLTLLSHGAKSFATNTIGKTPAQMAAFVGNHNCVTIINNYVPLSDVEFYTVCRGTETQPKLHPSLKSPLYSYIMQINIHPVRIAMKIPKVLVEEYPQVKRVLEALSEREIKKGNASNEVLSFKFHYLNYILNEIHKIGLSKKETDPAETFAKKILKGARGEEYLDLLLRDCVREFPFREGLLFQQMVKSLTRRADPPPALDVIVGAINSQSGFGDEYSPCITCSEPKAVKKCSKCKAVQYCDRECQRLHWFMHKKKCARSSTSGNSNAGKEEGDDIVSEIVAEGLKEEVENLKI